MASFATGSPDKFRRQYERHDEAEELMVTAIRAIGVECERAGFDPHEDGDRVTGHPGRNSDRSADLLAGGCVPIEVKTKKKRRHVGNVPRRKWDEYPDGTFFAWFHLDEHGVHGSWYYKKGEAFAVGLEDSPYGSEEWVVVRPLRPMHDLLARLEVLA